MGPEPERPPDDPAAGLVRRRAHRAALTLDRFGAAVLEEHP
ncbi:hypothetical protein [Streptomyces sp. NPDC058955]